MSLLTSADVAAKLGTTEPHVRLLAARGDLPAFRIGRLFRFDADEVDAWLAAARVDAPREMAGAR